MHRRNEQKIVVLKSTSTQMFFTYYRAAAKLDTDQH